MSHFFVSSGEQIVGERENQEDDYRIVPLVGSENHSEQLLVVLSDGMGGHAAGQVASRIVVDAFESYFKTHPVTDPPAMLREALDIANRSVGEEAARTPAYQGMGCTVVAALFDGDHAWWVSVGDSHLYLLRDRRVSRLNADHSYGGYLDQLAARGEDASNPQNLPRNMLMSAIIGEEIPMVDLPQEPYPLEGSDRFVLASDGLDTIQREELALQLEPGMAPTDYAASLIRSVEAIGKPRQDNTTVAVVEVRSAAKISTPESECETIDLGESGSGKGGLIAGVVIALLVAAVAGYLFVGSGKGGKGVSPAPSDERVAQGEARDGGEREVTAAESVDSGEPPEQEPEATPLVEPARLPDPIEVDHLRDRLANGQSGPELVIIPATSYEMGRDPDPIPTNEHPRHRVDLRSFAIGRYEVTIGEFNRFADDTGRPRIETGPDQLPVTNIGWQDAVDYTRWLSELSGQRYRLPSEAEWEHAHGANTINHYWWGIGLTRGMALCFDCLDTVGPNRPLAVGSFEPNPYGLYDTAGNVAEWMLDCYFKSHAGAPDDGSARDQQSCRDRVVRGGSFRTPSSALRVTSRSGFPPETAFEDIGFRVVRELE